MNGACVGSFLNVVVYRLPLGRSIVKPRSYCPKCSHNLAWYDNVPILGWLWLRGKCRYCKNPISAQYPLVELATALLFAGTFISYYYAGWRPGFGDSHPFFGELQHTWLPLIAHLILVAALFAATMIDARLFIIPLEIPWTATVVALILLPAGAFLSARGLLDPTFTPSLDVMNLGVGPVASPRWCGAALGGALGLAIALLLTRRGILPRSFADANDYCPSCGEHMGKDFQGEHCPHCKVNLATGQPAVNGAQSRAGFALKPWEKKKKKKGGARGPGSGESQAGLLQQETGANNVHNPAPNHGTPEGWLAYPHPRREILKEALFLLLPVVGMIVGYLVVAAPATAAGLPPSPRTTYPWHPAIHVLGGVVLGYLVGGGIVWGTRILGTLGFGKEAMGLGDVHLLAAVGAVLGPLDAVLAFFIAPFMGLTMVLVMAVVSRLRHGSARVIPYGPYLAAAAFLLMIAREPIGRLIGAWIGLEL